MVRGLTVDRASPVVSLEWHFPEPASPAMRETLEWLVLYLALGWEVPAWGPVPGVWFNDSEWTEVLNRIGRMVQSRDDGWIRLPHDLRRAVPVRGINPIPVLSERLEMIHELIMRDWPLVRPACRQVPGVRQFTFRGDTKLSVEAYQLTTGSFSDDIYRRINARKTHMTVNFPLPPRRALSPTDASRSCRSRTTTPSAGPPAPSPTPAAVARRLGV